MPSANKTPNIGLNQWQGNEYPKRQDFVDDNAAVDLEIVKKASSTQDGRMAKEDKVKLDGISAGANKVEQSSTNGNIKINGTEKTVYTHPGSGTNPHGTTKSDVGLANVTNDAQVKRTEMGTNNGVATLDASGVNAQAPKVHTHTKSQITDFPTSMPADGGNASTANKLATARTISLTGDATGSTPFDGSANKSIIVVLANSGAAAGTYTKLTIDAKGRVTSATALSASDIPNLDWSKITSGKPTTLGGYGILDAVSKYIALPSGTDLNTVVTSGFYRLDATSPNYTNLPPNSNVSYGQVIVSRGVDTAFQIITGYSNNEYYMRQGAKGGGTNTNFTAWQPWRRIWHDGNFDPDTKTKRINLAGQLQISDYRKSVIALCELTNTNPTLNSYSTGIINFKRSNGNVVLNSLYVGAEKQYNKSMMSYFGLGLGGAISNLRPCTFTYNGIKYGGVEFCFSSSQFSTIEFNGSGNFGIFGLDYYNTSTSTVLNQEVHDSLEFDTTIYKGPNLVYNNEKVMLLEDVDNAIDAIEIGGRNLLRNSTFNFGTWQNQAVLTILDPESDKPTSHICQVQQTASVVTNSFMPNPTRIYLNPSVGDTVTFSFDFFCEDLATYGPTGVVLSFRRFDAPQGGTQAATFAWSPAQLGITESNKWVRGKYTLGFTSATAVAGWYAVGLYLSNGIVGNTVRYKYREVKAELGNKATDWSPAPEDDKAYADNKILNLGITTNSSNAYSVSAPTGFTLQDGQLLVVKFNAASSGAITINVGGTGAKSVKDYFGNSITNVRANLPANLVYESSSDSFILLGKGGGGNAVAGDLLSGKTATVDAGQITGTIPLKSAQTYTPGTSNQTIASGQYLDGVQTILGDAALISANIKANASIFNVAGKSTVVDTEDATGVAADVRAGKTVYIKGNKVTGTKPVQATAAQTITPGTVDIVKPAGIYDDTITIKGEPNLIAPNLVAGKSHFGVAGSATIESLGGKKFYGGSTTQSRNDNNWTVWVGDNGTSMSFTPSVILIKGMTDSDFAVAWVRPIDNAIFVWGTGVYNTSGVQVHTSLPFDSGFPIHLSSTLSVGVGIPRGSGSYTVNFLIIG